MTEYGTEPIAVIGIGNRLCGDDSAGPWVADALRARALAGVSVHHSPRDTAELIELWSGARLAVLVDAAVAGGTPGEVYRFDAAKDPLPATALRCSTHACSPAEAVELSRALETLPPKVLVYGVEAEQFDVGTQPGEAVLRGCRSILAAIERDIEEETHA